MNEAQWLACPDPGLMLEFLAGKLSERKRRLFACACCRQVRRFAEQENYQRALNIAERHADGVVTVGELDIALQTVGFPPGSVAQGPGAIWFVEAMDCLSSRFWERSGLSDYVQGHAARAQRDALRAADWSFALREQAHILRDLAGYLFHPVVSTPTWLLERRDGPSRQLAQAIYQDYTFGDLPILADALEEAGCTDQAILDHLRGPGPHFRGCWVVDCILGRE